MGGVVPLLVAGAGAMVVLAVFAFSLKSQLIKPSRMVAAADKAGLYGKLPRLMFERVCGAGALDVQRRLALKEPEMAEMATKIFEEDWVAGEFEAIVYEMADAVKAGKPIAPELQLDPIKPNLVSVLSDTISAHSGSIGLCSGKLKPGKDLCVPDGVPKSLFLTQVRPELKKIVDKIPSRYSLLPRDMADQVQSATGIFGTMATLGWVFLVVAVGLGAGAFKLKGDDELPLVMFGGAGLAVGGAVLLVLIVIVRGGISAGVGGLVNTLEAGFGEVVGQFFSEVISGGFRFATILAAVSLAAGGGLFLYGRKNA